MAGSHLEPLLKYAERRAVVTVLRRHPEWTLGHVLRELEQNGPRAPVLRDLTLGELFEDPDRDPSALVVDGGPPIERKRLHAAEQLSGADFDECVRTVIAEARGSRVGAGYIRARVGGPRWKLQGSLGRLVAAGLVERSGTTSGTRYWIAGDRPVTRHP
jgi:hypothetical protein